METFGAQVTQARVGRRRRGVPSWSKIQLHRLTGIAISEAVEVAAQDPNTKYALGSVLNHVLLHQTVVGLETIAKFKLANDWPDIIIGCTGGGSNFAGIAFPFIGRKFRGEDKGERIIAVEPAACPSLTKGKLTYDFGDTGHLTPLVKMYTLGSSFIHPAFTPAAYGTTAWRRSSLICSSSVRSKRPPFHSSRCSTPPCVLHGRRHHSGPRTFARDCDRPPRGAALQSRGEEPRDPVQPLRSRALRHAGILGLLRQEAPRLRLSRARSRHGLGRTAERRRRVARTRDSGLGLGAGGWGLAKRDPSLLPSSGNGGGLGRGPRLEPTARFQLKGLTLTAQPAATRKANTQKRMENRESGTGNSEPAN